VTVPLALDLAANTVDTERSIPSLSTDSAPQLDQDVPPSVPDHTMHHPSDTTIEDEINGLADKLAAFCFEHLEEDLQLGYGNNVIDMNADQDKFNDELQVRDSNAIRS